MKSFLLSFVVVMCMAALPVAQQTVPEIQFQSVPDFLSLPPDLHFGEVAGVAVNSKGHVFVFTRSNSAGGPAYAPAAAQLLEFGAKGEFIREIGRGLTHGPLRIAFGSTEMTTSGRSIKAPIWSSSSMKKGGC